MKVPSKQLLIISGFLLTTFGLSSAVTQANPPGVINQGVIDYYRSLLETQELNQSTEGGVATYTTKYGEEKFYGYKSGRLDFSYAYRNHRPRSIYRRTQAKQRSSALTNYHSSAFKASLFNKEKPQKEFQRKKGDKINVRGIMMRHAQVKKKASE